MWLQPPRSRECGGVFVAISSQCFSDMGFAAACQQAADLGYDKIELWLNEASDHLKPSQIAASPTKFFQVYRETTRLSPIAINLQEDVQLDVFEGLCKL